MAMGCKAWDRGCQRHRTTMLEGREERSGEVEENDKVFEGDMLR